MGGYTYGSGTGCSSGFAGPHAVSSVNGTLVASYCYDNNGSLTQGNGRTVAWTAFNMPALIQQNSRQIALTYGPDRSRFKRVDQNETGTTTTYYVAGGGHEVVESGTTVTHKTYIGGAAVVLEVTSTPTSSTTLYLLHDHLGSTDAVTDASGNVQTRYSFDAWGARRNVTWAAFTGGMPASLWQTAKTTRGYTGHEELDEVGLVHMNGRVYDPQLGRFLSADPFVQDGTDLQAFNHYAYVRNNPLSLTDPSGFSFLGGIFNAIGKFFTGVFKAVENAVKAILKNSLIRAIIQIAACAFGGPIGCIAAAGGLTLGAGGTLDQALQAMAFSAISVAVWTGVGDFLKAAGAVMQSGFDVVRVLVHGVVQGALSVAQGGNFLNGFAIGAAGEGADVGMREAGLNNVAGDEGRYERAMIAGVAGGTASVLTGGKFANGAVSAAFAHLFNDEAHDALTAPGGGAYAVMSPFVSSGFCVCNDSGVIALYPDLWLAGLTGVGRAVMGISYAFSALSDDTVSLFRAIGEDEASSFPPYSGSPSGAGKYFAFNLDGPESAMNFATNPWNNNLGTITMTQADVPESFLANGTLFNDPGGAGASIHFADEFIPQLNQFGPRIIDR